MIEGIELVKMYAWDMELFKKIVEMRKHENNALYKIYKFMMFIRGFFEASTYIAMICILVPYIWIGGHTFQADHVFSALIISYIYRLHGVIFFSNGVMLYTQGRVVMRRIKTLLMTKDLDGL